MSFSNTKFLRNIFGSIADRFIFPSLGILYLWFVYIFKEHKKICYVNYLPLWNFLLFLFLPPKTIMGPITGGSKYFKKPYLNYYLRHIVLNFFCMLSIQILKFRKNKLLFSTDLLKINLIILKKLNSIMFLKILNFVDKNQNRKFDIIFYLRPHKNKNTLLNINLANSLSEKFTVVTIGEKSKIKK